MRVVDHLPIGQCRFTSKSTAFELHRVIFCAGSDSSGAEIGMGGVDVVPNIGSRTVRVGMMV